MLECENNLIKKIKCNNCKRIINYQTIYFIKDKRFCKNCCPWNITKKTNTYISRLNTFLSLIKITKKEKKIV